MKPSSRTLLALALCLMALLASCGTRQVSGKEAADAASRTTARQAGGPVVVVGTTLDASSRQPLAGVFVEGPGGTQAQSDARGRFLLRGLAVGAQGELVATGPDGRRGSVRLRPLERGSLEVVLFLR
jgi:hypothetical protein